MASTNIKSIRVSGNTYKLVDASAKFLFSCGEFDHPYMLLTYDRVGALVDSYLGRIHVEVHFQRDARGRVHDVAEWINPRDNRSHCYAGEIKLKSAGKVALDCPNRKPDTADKLRLSFARRLGAARRELDSSGEHWRTGDQMGDTVALLRRQGVECPVYFQDGQTELELDEYKRKYGRMPERSAA